MDNLIKNMEINNVVPASFGDIVEKETESIDKELVFSEREKKAIKSIKESLRLDEVEISGQNSMGFIAKQNDKIVYFKRESSDVYTVFASQSLPEEHMSLRELESGQALRGIRENLAS